MSDFVRYQHIERLGLCGNELDGLLEGEVYVFPKLDGACHCVYFDKDLGRVAIASRNQLLSEGYDSTGFWHFVKDHPAISEYVTKHPYHRLYGEYLTPHTIRNYVDDAWGRWFVFDIWDDTLGKWLPWKEVDAIVMKFLPGISCIPPIGIRTNPTIDQIIALMDKDTYILQKDTQGEGVVIKNYDYVNPYGRRTWGKIIRENFKAKAHSKNKGERVVLPEETATDDSITQEFVSKEFHKFTTDRGVQWDMSMTPDFLKHIWKEWWTDYSFSVLSDMKTVDMKAVRKTLSSKTMKLLTRIAMEN